MNKEIFEIKKLVNQKRKERRKHHELIDNANRLEKINVKEKNDERIHEQIEQETIAKEKYKVLNEIEIREMI